MIASISLPKRFPSRLIQLEAFPRRIGLTSESICPSNRARKGTDRGIILSRGTVRGSFEIRLPRRGRDRSLFPKKQHAAAPATPPDPRIFRQFCVRMATRFEPLLRSRLFREPSLYLVYVTSSAGHAPDKYVRGLKRHSTRCRRAILDAADVSSSTGVRRRTRESRIVAKAQLNLTMELAKVV